MTVDVDELADALAERLLPKLAGCAAAAEDDEPAADDRPLYTVASLCERLGLSDRVVRQMLSDNVIPSFRVGGARRVDPVALDEYLARQRAAEGGQD